MTPDQLPPGVRVKALEWRTNGDRQWFIADVGNDDYEIGTAADGTWEAFSSCIVLQEGLKTKQAALDICQRHHEEQVCAQLEIVNG